MLCKHRVSVMRKRRSKFIPLGVKKQHSRQVLFTLQEYVHVNDSERLLCDENIAFGEKNECRFKDLHK